MPSDQNQLASTLKRSILVAAILFASLWAVFGVVAFFVIQHWDRQHDQKLALIAAGQVQPQTLYIASVNRIKGDRINPVSWSIGLARRPNETDPQSIEYHPVPGPDNLAVGQTLTAYKINGQWFIPSLVSGTHWGKWVFLAIALAPALAIAAIALLAAGFRRSRPRAQAARAIDS